MSEEIKACPFCGCEETEIGYGDSGWTVQCHSWTCRSETGIHPSEELAIAAWNRRAPQPSIPHHGPINEPRHSDS